MRSAATVFASVLASAALAFAQDEPTSSYADIYIPESNQVIPSGKQYTIQWDAREQTGPATLILLGGNDPATLQVLSTVASKFEASWSFVETPTKIAGC
jgi:hypothetical protein